MDNQHTFSLFLPVDPGEEQRVMRIAMLWNLAALAVLAGLWSAVLLDLRNSRIRSEY